MAAPFFSKHLFIHGIVNNFASERLREDWYHNIIKIKCFRVANSGVFKKFFADFHFLYVHRLFRDYLPETNMGLKKRPTNMISCGVKKNRGSSRFEGQSPQLEMIPYLFFKLIFFCLKSKSLAPPVFSKHLLNHGIVNNSACEWLGENWYHNLIKIKSFRVAKSGIFKKLFADFTFL